MAGYRAGAAAGGGVDLTTKGDMHGYDTEQKRIPIGTNDKLLVADSAQALGLKYANIINAMLTSGVFGKITGIGAQVQVLNMQTHDVVSSGYFRGSSSSLSIVAGLVTANGHHHFLDTENNDPTDDLNTVNGTADSTELYFRSTVSSKDVTFVDGTNMEIAGNFTLDTQEDRFIFGNNAGGRSEYSRSNNA